MVSGAKWTLLLALPAAGVFFLLGDRFIALWIGKDIAESALLLKILTIGILAHLCEMTVTTTLVGMGRAHVVARWVLAQAAVNLVLSLALVRPFGLMGVALGTSISMVLFAVISIPVYFRYHLHVPLGDFARRALLPPLWVQIPWIGALFLLRDYVPMPSLGAFFGVLALTLPLYGAFVFALCLSPAERASVSGRFGPKFRPRAARSE
jgi:O-antigen/teichoic acid export membrane protein